jgi:hypothetical protein
MHGLHFFRLMVLISSSILTSLVLIKERVHPHVDAQAGAANTFQDYKIVKGSTGTLDKENKVREDELRLSICESPIPVTSIRRTKYPKQIAILTECCGSLQPIRSLFPDECSMKQAPLNMG